jgi:hypothetical protein
MVELQVTFEQRKWIFQYCWTSKNLTEERRLWRNEFVTPSPTSVTITSLRDKFEADGDMKI